MARRGLLATIIHSSRVAARERERTQRVAVREHHAAVIRAEQAQRSAARLQAQLSRTSAADRKRLEKESREAHIAAMEAEVEERNLGLEEINSDYEGILQSTLDVDDYVDLETYRARADHPHFDPRGLDVPVPPPGPMPDPPNPVFVEPEPPKGLIGALFGKKKHQAAVEAAHQAHETNLRVWEAQVKQLASRRETAARDHAQSEAQRADQLSAEQTRYENECIAREKEAVEQNKKLDEFKANLSYGLPDAVQEYLSIVLANSAYADHFAVEHDFTFDPATAELRLKVLVPGPSTLSEIKAYKYAKSADEIASTTMTQKSCRDRYASVVNQVALRSLHEVFEADRRGLIGTIALEVGCHALDPATGLPKYVPFVAVGAERDMFLTFDLASVVPAKTLERLGAVISKNPYSLVAVDPSGVKRS